MNWLTARRVILVLYGAGFLLLALLLVYGAIVSAKVDRPWLQVLAALLATAEGVGLLLSLGIARLGLKVALALGVWFAATQVIENGAWEALFVPVGFAGLLLLEFGFLPVDRKIADARRAEGTGRGDGSPR
jgi:hypothetical protein